jgi:hypothetical protein
MTQEDNARQRAMRKAEILIFTALLFAGMSFHHIIDYDNTSSRYFLVSGVVDHGTLNIDANEKDTIDKSSFGGHYYSNKAIGSALLGVPVYWVFRHLPGGSDVPPLSQSARYMVRVVTTTLPFALLGAIMFRLACSAGASPLKALLMVIAYAFGTIAFIHATIFSGHQITACFAFFSLALLFQPGKQLLPPASSLRQSLRFLFAGMSAGLAAITDFPALIIVFFLTIYVLSLRPGWRNIALFIAGGLLFAVLVAAYNMKCFGNPFSLSYSHLSLDKFRDEAKVGLFGISTPSFQILSALLFSPSRGLFIIMPVLFLSIVGLGTMIVRKQYLRETYLIIAICVAYLLFNASYGCGWHGGWTYGSRYLVPMLAFMAFPIALGKWSPFTYLLLMMMSLFQVLPAVAGLPHMPEDVKNPLLEIIIPCMAQGYLAHNAGMLLGLKGLLSLIPIAVITGLVLAASLRVIQPFNNAEPDNEREASRFAVYAWLGIIICLLAFTRTEPQKLVHAYRWRLLSHGAWMTKSQEMWKGAHREAALAEDLAK